jgi:hypothetical protein
VNFCARTSFDRLRVVEDSQVAPAPERSGHRVLARQERRTSNVFVGRDALYATNATPEIDGDAREEYWREIRDAARGRDRRA